MSSKSTGQTDTRASVNDLTTAAEDLLRFAAGQEFAESDLFPYGVNRISVHIKAGETEIALEISGPDHTHDQDLEGADDWALEDEVAEDAED